jgi:hydroxypyruvate reductase
MLNAFAAAESIPLRHILGVGPSLPPTLPQGTQWFAGGHPLPNDQSVAAAARALEIASRSGADDLLVVLLSGGGSALMALPAEGITLEEKQQTARLLMTNGADIYELNTVRKHLSAIKGGQLAAASLAATVTLAISDVVGDDLSVIASGPTVADGSTFGDALAVVNRRGGAKVYPPAVMERLEAGSRGRMRETPDVGDSRLARSVAWVIGRQRGAIDGATLAAEALGYHVLVVDEPITGEAREAATAFITRLADDVQKRTRPLCVISSGETTVTVRGQGRGGRNQEFALSMARGLPRLGRDVVATSIGTDGIDGPTDAAGAVVDPSTLERAASLGLDAQRYLDDNDSYAFFDRLGDLIRTGPTSTNVGDLQVMLIA